MKSELLTVPKSIPTIPNKNPDFLTFTVDVTDPPSVSGDGDGSDNLAPNTPVRSLKCQELDGRLCSPATGTPGAGAGAGDHKDPILKSNLSSASMSNQNSTCTNKRPGRRIAFAVTEGEDDDEVDITRTMSQHSTFTDKQINTDRSFGLYSNRSDRSKFRSTTGALENYGAGTSRNQLERRIQDSSHMLSFYPSLRSERIPSPLTSSVYDGESMTNRSLTYRSGARDTHNLTLRSEVGSENIAETQSIFSSSHLHLDLMSDLSSIQSANRTGDKGEKHPHVIIEERTLFEGDRDPSSLSRGLSIKLTTTITERDDDDSSDNHTNGRSSLSSLGGGLLIPAPGLSEAALLSVADLNETQLAYTAQPVPLDRTESRFPSIDEMLTHRDLRHLLTEGIEHPVLDALVDAMATVGINNKLKAFQAFTVAQTTDPRFRNENITLSVRTQLINILGLFIRQQLGKCIAFVHTCYDLFESGTSETVCEPLLGAPIEYHIARWAYVSATLKIVRNFCVNEEMQKLVLQANIVQTLIIRRPLMLAAYLEAVRITRNEAVILSADQFKAASELRAGQSGYINEEAMAAYEKLQEVNQSLATDPSVLEVAQVLPRVVFTFFNNLMSGNDSIRRSLVKYMWPSTYLDFATILGMPEGARFFDSFCMMLHNHTGLFIKGITGEGAAPINSVTDEDKDGVKLLKADFLKLGLTRDAAVVRRQSIEHRLSMMKTNSNANGEVGRDAAQLAKDLEDGAQTETLNSHFWILYAYLIDILINDLEGPGSEDGRVTNRGPNSPPVVQPKDSEWFNYLQLTLLSMGNGRATELILRELLNSNVPKVMNSSERCRYDMHGDNFEKCCDPSRHMISHSLSQFESSPFSRANILQTARSMHTLNSAINMDTISQGNGSPDTIPLPLPTTNNYSDVIHQSPLLLDPTEDPDLIPIFHRIRRLIEPVYQNGRFVFRSLVSRTMDEDEARLAAESIGTAGSKSGLFSNDQMNGSCHSALSDASSIEDVVENLTNVMSDDIMETSRVGRRCLGDVSVDDEEMRAKRVACVLSAMSHYAEIFEVDEALSHHTLPHTATSINDATAQKMSRRWNHIRRTFVDANIFECLSGMFNSAVTAVVKAYASNDVKRMSRINNDEGLRVLSTVCERLAIDQSLLNNVSSSKSHMLAPLVRVLTAMILSPELMPLDVPSSTKTGDVYTSTIGRSTLVEMCECVCALLSDFAKAITVETAISVEQKLLEKSKDKNDTSVPNLTATREIPHSFSELLKYVSAKDLCILLAGLCKYDNSLITVQKEDIEALFTLQRLCAEDPGLEEASILTVKVLCDISPSAQAWASELKDKSSEARRQNYGDV